MKKLLFFAIAIIGFSATSFGQTPVGPSASATATGTIITPIAIEKSTDGDMNFGNIAVNGTGGTVIINAETGARTKTGGVAFPTIQGTIARASFDVSGLAGSVYAITIPTSSIDAVSGGNTMAVGSWSSYPTVAAGGILDGSGTQTIKVGATLTVGASQPAGTYVTPAFEVTVCYN